MTCTWTGATRLPRGKAGSELQEAIFDAIGPYPAEAPMDALTVQPRDDRARAREWEPRPPPTSPSLPCLGAWCRCRWGPD